MRGRKRTSDRPAPAGQADIVEVDEPGLDVRTAIVRPLDDYVREMGHPFAETRVAFGLMAGRDIDGGLAARIVWDWMYVEMLSVPAALRGQGLGRRLMARAEGRARDEGCRGIWLDTFTFQAPGFYEKLGYERFGELPEHPAGHARYFYRKLLD